MQGKGRSKEKGKRLDMWFCLFWMPLSFIMSSSFYPWSQLEQALFSTGQPRPHLTEALQPLCWHQCTWSQFTGDLIAAKNICDSSKKKQTHSAEKGMGHFSHSNKLWVGNHSGGSWRWEVHLLSSLAAFAAPDKASVRFCITHLQLSDTERNISELKQRSEERRSSCWELRENGAVSALVPEEKMAPGCCRLLVTRAPHSVLWNAVQKLGRLWPEHLQQPAFLNAQVPTVPGNCFLTLRWIYKRRRNFSSRAPERKTLSSAFVEFISHWLNDLGKPWKARLLYLVFLLSYLTDWWLSYLSLKPQHLKLWRKREVPRNYHILLCLLLRR